VSDDYKISVLTPSYNSGKYIERAIQSVLNQDYDNWEHIIVDGGSSDNTLEILRKYSHLNWICEPDKGQSDAMNKAFKMSAGDIIVYLNADDYFNTDIFRKVIEEFKSKDPDIVVGKLRIYRMGEILLREPVSNFKYIIKYWKHLFPANPLSYFYKRSVQQSIGPFPLEDHYAMDYWFLLRSFRRFKVTTLEEEFGVFWMDGSNKTATSDVNTNLNRTFREYLSRQTLAFRLAYHWLNYGAILQKQFRKLRKKTTKLFFKGD
jgi:glycosyltransferase involved in cell wall biosynthesis